MYEVGESEVKYNKRGQEICVVCKLEEDSFIVEFLDYEQDEWNEWSYTRSGVFDRVTKVWDSPPYYKYSDGIEELRETRKRLIEQIGKANTELKWVRAKTRTMQDTLDTIGEL